MSNKIKISEIFKSVQGEGPRTGRLSIWIRFFGCNLACPGFGQDDPTNPETYILPYKTIDLSKIEKIEDLPVFEFGCDSAYSWSAKYKHLIPEYTVEEVYEEIVKLLPNDAGEPIWYHPRTLNEIDLCFTGGEPMLPGNQKFIIELLDYILEKLGLLPIVQIETNGTQSLEDGSFYDWGDIHFNISPKLFFVSGEAVHKAWKPEIIKSYYDAGGPTILKFVVNNTHETWREWGGRVAEILDLAKNMPIYVMFVGATKEQQSDPIELKKFADKAVEEGYHISGRLHCHLWGNVIKC